VVVPVGAGLLVVEAQGVEQLVLHGAVVQAALAGQGQNLLSPTTTNGRKTPGRQQEDNPYVPKYVLYVKTISGGWFSNLTSDHFNMRVC